MQILRRNPVLLSLVVSLLLLGAPAQAQTDRRAAIEELLQRRAEAILERDRDAFAATLADAGSAFGRRQLQFFDNLAGVPLAAYELAADWSVYGDLVRPSDRRRYAADDVAIPFVREAYRLEGFDRRKVYHDAYFTFVEQEGTWAVASDSDLDDLGLFTQRSLWDFDPIALDHSDHFLSVAARCCSPDTGRLLSTAEQALDRVDRYWTEGWNKKVPLFVPASTDDLSSILQATYPVENYVAFAYWTGGAGDSTGARVIVNPERFSGDGSLRSFEILSHELFHVATLPRSGPFVPNWLDEGIAQFVQYDGDAGKVDSFDIAVASTGDAHAPESYEFFVGDETAIYRQYQRSLSLIGYVVDRWGYERLERLYVELGRAGDEPGVERFHVDRAVRDVLGLSLRDLELGWASSIGA